jgi:uncharacterized protein
VDAASEEPPLNVDPFVQLRLLDLQAVDTRLDQVAHRRAGLPEAVTAAELGTELARLSDAIVAAKTLVSDLEREQSKADADVDLVRQRAAKDRQMLDSGSITNAKQLESLQQELQSLARRQNDLEDVELEVMERLEEATSAQAALLAERDALAERLQQAEAARDAAFAEMDAESQGLVAERGQLAEGIDAGLMTLYDKLRADNGGVGAAPLYRGRCEGCRIELTPVDIARIRSAPAQEVLRCEECRRILVRTAESGL